jgi:hypothetical protein
MMSDETKDKHTPGDWHVEIYQDSADTRAARVWTDRPETDGCKANPDICHVYAIGDDGRPGGEMEANAKLIAAAPKLLACLREVVNMAIAAGGLRGDDVQYGLGTADWIEGMDKAIKTIRKARGEA